MPRPPSTISGPFVRWLRRLDERLMTRPLFEMLLAGGGMSPGERTTAIIHTVVTAIRFHSARLGWAVTEAAGAVLLRQVLGSRAGTHGMVRFLELAEGTWWRPTGPYAVHRCRIALGRLRGRVGRASVTLFCGYDASDGDPPAFVLFRDRRVVEMAFDAGDGRISPGIGRLAPSGNENLEALRALCAHLSEGVAEEDCLDDFL